MWIKFCAYQKTERNRFKKKFVDIIAINLQVFLKVVFLWILLDFVMFNILMLAPFFYRFKDF